MIRSLLTLAALAALVALTLGLPGCETSDYQYRRSDRYRNGYYDDYYGDRYYRSRCCYNGRAVSGPRGGGAPPPPPPPPPPP